MSIFGYTQITNGISKCAMFVDIAETITKLLENQIDIFAQQQQLSNPIRTL